VNDNQDRLMDQMIEEAARKNGPPDLRAKIMAAASNQSAPRNTGKLIALPQRRVRVLPIAITAIAALIVLTVLANIDFVRDLVTRANNGTRAQSASTPSTGSGQAGLPGNAPAPEEPKSVKAPDVSDGSAFPPANESPQEQPKPDQPKPDEPRKPDEVRKPEEKPPEERKPDGEVEKPRQPEETQPKETPRKEPAVIANVLGKPKLKLRYAEHEAWSEHDGATLKSGVQLQARGYVDLTLTSGALMRISGEVVLSGDGGKLESSMLKDELYFDNRGCNQPLTIISQKLRAELKDGAALFSESPGALEIACLDGEVSTSAGVVAAGSMKRLTSRGLGAAKPFAMDRTLTEIPARVLLREDFDQEPKGGLYGGVIEKGVAMAKGHAEFVAFRFNPTLTVLPRMALRFSVRCSRAQRLQLELFEQGGSDQPWLIHLTPKQGEWVEVTVKFDDLRLRDKPAARLAADTLLRNFKLYVEGEKDASLEIDWVEFVRLGPGE
jgi:hypothetical protein